MRFCFILIHTKGSRRNGIDHNTKDLYENDAFVIIEAEFEDSETKKRMQEISLGLKNNQGDITKIRTIHRKQF